MARWFDRTLDRELGPAGSGRRSARDSWLRDWPLLLGLVLSAALIAGSTAVRGSDAEPAEASKASAQAGSGVTGQVVDVGEGQPPAAPEAPEASVKPGAVKKKRSSPPSAGTGGAATTKPAAEPRTRGGSPSSPGSSASAPPPTGGTTSGGAGRSGRRPEPSGGGRPSGGGPSAPVAQSKIVNVTGTSAAFTNGPLAYSFSAPTHAPVVGRRWVLRVSARRSGKPLRGQVRIDILNNGKVVGQAGSGALADGRFAQKLDWPERSVGYPLIVKTTIVAGGYQQSFLFSIKVKRGS